MELKDKVAFITGGGTGIGLAAAQAFLAEGASVTVFSRSIPESAELDALRKNKQALVMKGDITDAEGVRKALLKTVNTFGGLHILVNNAAIAHRKSFEQTTPKDWDEIIDINIKGTLTVTHTALPFIKASGGGIIINIASGAGIYGIGGLSLYSLTKAALINFTQSLHEEVAPDHIRVFTVAPGSTDTGMFRELFPDHPAAHTPEHVASVIVKAIGGIIKPDDHLIVDVFEHER